MAMTAGRLLFGNRLMVSARVIALAVHFTMPRDAAAQAVMGQPIPLMDRVLPASLHYCLPTDKSPAPSSSNV